MTDEGGGETPFPPLCAACKQFHHPVEVCPAFVKETKDERDQRRADALEQEKLDWYDSTSHNGRPPRRRPHP